MKVKLLLLFTLLFSGCFRVKDTLEPSVDYSIEDKYIQSLDSAFFPLTEQEKEKPFAQELIIAKGFINELDLYRAVSTLKRALFLVPESSPRKQEIEYDIIYSYYLAKKYDEVIETFESSDLPNIDITFPAFHDLLVILYESYSKEKDQEKKEKILELMQENFPGTYKKIRLSSHLLNADIPQLKKIADSSPKQNDISAFINDFSSKKKSVKTAQTLNAILPGAGYYYIGQKRSALTAFLLNGLFIAATYEFFHKGYIPAGIITAGFEAGWYFGGIYGAGEEAKFYNERIYEKNASNLMNNKKLFPLFMLQYAF